MKVFRSVRFPHRGSKQPLPDFLPGSPSVRADCSDAEAGKCPGTYCPVLAWYKDLEATLVEVSILPSQCEHNTRLRPGPRDEGQQSLGLLQILTFIPADSWCPKHKAALAWSARGIRITLVECKHLFKWQLNPLAHGYCPTMDTVLCAPLGAAQGFSDGKF